MEVYTTRTYHSLKLHSLDELKGRTIYEVQKYYNTVKVTALYVKNIIGGTVSGISSEGAQSFSKGFQIKNGELFNSPDSVYYYNEQLAYTVAAELADCFICNLKEVRDSYLRKLE